MSARIQAVALRSRENSSSQSTRWISSHPWPSPVFTDSPLAAVHAPAQAAIAETTGRATPIATCQRGQRASPPLTRSLVFAQRQERVIGGLQHQPPTSSEHPFNGLRQRNPNQRLHRVTIVKN